MISYASPCLVGLDVMPDIEMFVPYCEDSDNTQTVINCFESCPARIAERKSWC